MRTIRRVTVMGGLGICAVLLVVSAAWACVEAFGNTWYTDGSAAKSGPAGTVLSVYAMGAFPNVPYTLVLGHPLAGNGNTHSCMVVVQELNHNVRYANSKGFLSTTVGTVAEGIPAGRYQVCFEDKAPEGRQPVTATAGGHLHRDLTRSRASPCPPDHRRKHHQGEGE